MYTTGAFRVSSEGLFSFLTSIHIMVNPLTAETDFRRQNLTSVNVRYLRLNSVPTRKD